MDIRMISLSKAQANIVNSPIGSPIQILASAGSGKTRVLTERIRFILENTKKDRVIALTFTNKAAEEMQERLLEVDDIEDRAWISTVHSIAQRILEQYGHILRRKTFKVYWVVDRDTQKSSYVKVEGKVIFSYFLRHVEYYNSGRNKKIKPVVKITIHDQGKGKFRAVLLLPYVTENKEVLSCIDEDGNWVAIIEKQRSSNEVVQWIEDWSKMHESTLPPDAKALPFLIRKALLNHGFTVEDVVDYPASW